MEAQFTATKGWRARAESWWMAWASRSLPVPVSPRIITGMSRSTTLRSLPMTLDSCASPVSRYCRDDSGVLRDAGAGRAGASPDRVSGETMGAAQGLDGLISVRHQTVTPLCRHSWRGVAPVLPNSSKRADIGRLKSEEKVCACRAVTDMPSWNCALRLAAMNRPSGVKAAMPSASVPRNSGREWKCRRTALGKLPANMWFSNICADMRTSASVCWW